MMAAYFMKMLVTVFLSPVEGTKHGGEPCVNPDSSTCMYTLGDESSALQLTRNAMDWPAVEVDAVVDLAAAESEGFEEKQVTPLVSVYKPTDEPASVGEPLQQMDEYTTCATDYCHLNLTTRIIRLAPGHEAGNTYTRGFAGGRIEFPVGPTFRIKPGATLKIILNNQLELPSPGPKELAKERNEEFSIHEHFIGYLNHTNIHTHGLHASGSKFSKDYGDSEDRVEDYIFASVGPGESETYDVILPANHMGGLHWYHAHHHHATAFQAGGGSAGLIVVEDPPGYFEHAGIPQISEMREFLMILTMFDSNYLNQIGGDGGDKMMTLPPDELQLFVNGQINPYIYVRPYEWIRLRMCFSAVERAVRAQEKARDIEKDAQCEFQLLAKDGVYLHSLPRKVSSLSFFPGARADVAVRCHCPGSLSVCSGLFVSNSGHNRAMQTTHNLGYDSADTSQEKKEKDEQGIGKQNSGGYDGDIFELAVAGTPMDKEDLPVVSVTRPCYVVDLQNAKVPRANQHELELKGNAPTGTPGLSMRALRWRQNPDEPKLSHDDWTQMPWLPEEPNLTKLKAEALGNVTLGDVHQIKFKGFDRHPLHVHVNPYQIQTWADVDDEYFQPGDWHDVLMDKTKISNVRFQTDCYGREIVLHCHFIRHEDSGMMGWLWADEPEQGDTCLHWSGAKELDPTCYDDHFPHTPAPTPSFVRSTKAESPYEVGVLNTNECPEGAQTITDMRDCLDYSMAFRLKFVRNHTWANRPHGCFQDVSDQGKIRVYFNHRTGKKKITDSPVCRRDGVADWPEPCASYDVQMVLSGNPGNAIPGGTAYSEIQTPTIEDCAKWCMRDRRCKGIAYGTATDAETAIGKSDGYRANDCVFNKNLLPSNSKDIYSGSYWRWDVYRVGCGQ